MPCSPYFGWRHSLAKSSTSVDVVKIQTIFRCSYDTNHPLVDLQLSLQMKQAQSHQSINSVLCPAKHECSAVLVGSA